MSKISFAINASTIILAYDGKNFRIKRNLQISEDVIEETELAKKILEAIRNNQLDSETSPIPEYVDLEESLKNSPFLIVNGQVYIEGKLAPKAITDKIIQYKENGIPYESIVNFYKNVLKNPTKSAQEELFLFLEHNGHPFTEEGFFLAYKAVLPNFYSKYGYSDGSSRNVLNAPQTWVEMERAEVDSDRNRTCSSGLHCANYEYAKKNYGSSGDMLLEVIVDPKDVVSIPADYNNTKMRVCRYFVVGPCDGESKKVLYKDWNQSQVINPNAPTNMVAEGDCGNDWLIDEDETLDEEVINSLSDVVEPIAQVEPETEYYSSYVNAVGATWKFKSYRSGTKELTYVESVIYPDPRETVIIKGDKVPVSWKPIGNKLTNLWPVKATINPMVTTGSSDVFGNVAKAYVGTVLTSPTTPMVKSTKVPDAFSAAAQAFIDPKVNIFRNKVDPRLNHLTQVRENGKFVKKNS